MLCSTLVMLLELCMLRITNVQKVAETLVCDCHKKKGVKKILYNAQSS